MKERIQALWRRTLVRRMLGFLAASFLLVDAALLAFEYVDFERNPGDYLGIQRRVALDVSVLARLPNDATAAQVISATIAQINANRHRAAELPGDVLSQLRHEDGTIVSSSEGLHGARLLGRTGEVAFQDIGNRSYWVVQSRAKDLTLTLAEPRVDSFVLRQWMQLLTTRILIAFPLVFLPLWLAIVRGLRPLRQLSEGIAAREPGDLAPLDMDLRYEELTPMTAEFNGMLARLRRHVEREHTFVQDAAHELRTPLAAIAAHSEVLAHAPDERQRLQAKAALDQALSRTSHLAEQLLQLAALDATPPTRLARLDLVDVVQQTMAIAALKALARNIDLSLEAPESCPFELDRSALEAALDNLIDNALKYVPEHGHVVVRLAAEAHGITLTVSDDGPGIAADLRTRIFDRFWRGSHRDTPGSGLGLAIVQQAVERLGARIDVEDGLEGRGVAFKMAIARPGSIEA